MRYYYQILFPQVKFVNLTFSRRLNSSINFFSSINFSHIFVLYNFSNFSVLFGLIISSKKAEIFQSSFCCPLIMKWGPDHTERQKKEGRYRNAGRFGGGKMRGCLSNSSYFSGGGEDRLFLER